MKPEELHHLLKFIKENGPDMKCYVLSVMDQSGMVKMNLQANLMEVCFMSKSLDNAAVSLMGQAQATLNKRPAPESTL